MSAARDRGLLERGENVATKVPSMDEIYAKRHLCMDHLKRLSKHLPSQEHYRRYLIAYYIQNPQGKEEFEASVPHRIFGKSVEEVADDLLKERFKDD